MRMRRKLQKVVDGLNCGIMFIGLNISSPFEAERSNHRRNYPVGYDGKDQSHFMRIKKCQLVYHTILYNISGPTRAQVGSSKPKVAMNLVSTCTLRHLPTNWEQELLQFLTPKQLKTPRFITTYIPLTVIFLLNTL
jgi:hypothetical protein